MKILFVVGNLYPRNDANSNIVRILSKEFTRLGHTVDILGKSEINTPPVNENIFYYSLPQLNNINSYFPQAKTPIHKALYLFSHKAEYNFWQKMRKTENFVENEFVICCKNRIEELYSQKKYDCIISVSMPIWTSIALSLADVCAIKVEYRLDPYAYNHLITNTSFDYKINIEAEILEQMNLAFLPILDYSDMINDVNIKDFTRKLFPIEFPNLIHHKTSPTPLSDSIISEPLSFAFIGYLYEDIRNPLYMLDFFVKLNQDINFKLYIIGGGCEEILKKYKQILGDNLQIIAHVNSTEAYAVMNSTSFLINLGNSIYNMVPSKIIDYISTGKPILNFTKIKNCPTLQYMVKYENSFSLLDYEWEQNYTKIKEFVQKNHKQIDYNEIELLYNQNTPSFVANFILDKIHKRREVL